MTYLAQDAGGWRGNALALPLSRHRREGNRSEWLCSRHLSAHMHMHHTMPLRIVGPHLSVRLLDTSFYLMDLWGQTKSTPRALQHSVPWGSSLDLTGMEVSCLFQPRGCPAPKSAWLKELGDLLQSIYMINLMSHF